MSESFTAALDKLAREKALATLAYLGHIEHFRDHWTIDGSRIDYRSDLHAALEGLNFHGKITTGLYPEHPSRVSVTPKGGHLIAPPLTVSRTS